MSPMICPTCWACPVVPICGECEGGGEVPDAQLSENFRLSELLHSASAVNLRLDNAPTDANLANLRALASTLLQPIRERFGVVRIYSGLRLTAVNKAVGGTDYFDAKGRHITSAHIDGRAADLGFPSASFREVMSWLVVSGLPFDQVIYEGAWIHVQIARLGATPRKQALVTFDKKNFVLFDIKDLRIR